ncbi:transmembrane O-methyltransferase homolog [Phycodurus eques]|uniref:transmembrane O-methyltransferase homolog n=1 Tax=Phycodurus eques TaxID=693459 RepID=UPI002ACD3E4A|nr:transmembrane O-methyltransferase homolog [Phycodurus eques]XP_061541823.1 transmembrane O-methyltransferase homolog [Phycodurus eques]XP_061541824.1 transmembrane O-methyltransferase homolog [Phycodurus eques]XP_061541825.1 transmembrane O-methyltransferase homolog [Phycodurus eques]XP_061541826.1 transmembrane O-methyltransferase homolog [Phycodurus eques]XP_061541827.1 transmembrane O-methyltransferase homolog [Phycodurus eques]
MSSWLMAVSLPLLPAVLLVLGRHRVRVAKFWRGALDRMRRLLRGRACAKSTHAFVFSRCIHGDAGSVLETFDLYAETHASASVGPQIGEALDKVVRRVRPSRVLELGTHCGYSSVLLLSLLPADGRLLTVEQDPAVADLGEEIILVAGFKPSQFQVLTGSSGNTIPTLHPFMEPAPGTGNAFNLVLMDHDPQQYLVDLLALEREGLLCLSGCSIVLIIRNQRDKSLEELISARPDCYSIKSQVPGMVELFYQKNRT